jgi:hypothetical protein
VGDGTLKNGLECTTKMLLCTLEAGIGRYDFLNIFAEKNWRFCSKQSLIMQKLDHNIRF